MQNLIFVDLDDTLFQTLRKCHNPDGESGNHGLTPRAFLKDGSVISYSTAKQDRFWQWLSTAERIIPVTARNFDAYSRVNLNFNDYAVLNHGAVIVDKQRQLDAEWQAYMISILPPYQNELEDLWEQVASYAAKHPGLRPRLIADFGVTWYGVVKHELADEAALVELLRIVMLNHPALQAGRLYFHINGNNLAIIPEVVGKAHAVEFLLARFNKIYDNILTIGIGDSKTDKDFMSLCDYAVIPSNTQLGAMFREL